MKPNFKHNSVHDVFAYLSRKSAWAQDSSLVAGPNVLRPWGQAEGAAWLQATRGRASPRVTAPELAASAPSCDVVPRSAAGGPATAGGCAAGSPSHVHQLELETRL